MEEMLLKLRRESYEAAGEFHVAQSYFFTTIREDRAVQIQAAKAVQGAGAKYRAALEALLAHLDTIAPCSENEQKRTKNILSILERELALLPKFD